MREGVLGALSAYTILHIACFFEVLFWVFVFE